MKEKFIIIGLNRIFYIHYISIEFPQIVYIKILPEEEFCLQIGYMNSNQNEKRAKSIVALV